jgi:Carboxypeptidase regulatory-like domain
MSFSKFMMAAGVSIMFCLLLTTSLFAQNSAINGTVSDPTNALIPGVTVTATNTGTAVAATVLTNDSGAYNFVSLPPGPYKLTATLQGFQTATVSNVTLGSAETQRFNIVLRLGSAAGTTVDVAVDASTIIAQSSPSIGEALNADKVRDLPMIGGDVLQLINTVAGVNGTGAQANFAGIGAGSINTVRDGLSVSDGRFVNGVFATTVINPDLVGEIKIILAPVDAEMGRGNGQVIVTTRSGTNRFTGAATLLYTNSGLNPNTWAGNQVGSFKDDSDTACAVQQASDSCKWTLTNKPAWFSNYHPTVSFGGPIIKNKTFFFVLWDQQKNFQRPLTTATVLTDTARNGVFRYFDNWNNGNAGVTVTGNTVGSTTGTYPVVDINGNPVTPAFNPGGGAYTGGLNCYSVFGGIKADGTPFTAADCPGGTARGVGGAAWDTNRPIMDTTGYIAKILKEMPHANNFAVVANNIGTGDGLNTAAMRYVRSRHGNTGAAVTTGTDLNTDRWQFNAKIDHNFNAKEKLSGAWTYEKNKTDSDTPNWPDEISYTTKRWPQVFTVNFTSTLSSSLLNEARMGIRYENAGIDAPWETTYPDSSVQSRAQSFMMNLSGTAPVIGTDGYFASSPDCGSKACYQTLINPTLFGGNANGVMATNPGQYNGNQSPLLNFADTFSWTMGRHAFKFGVETNMTQTKGYSNITAGGGIALMYPILNGGAGSFTSPLTTVLAGIPNNNGTNRTNAGNLEYFLAGAVNNATQIFWIDSASDVAAGTWQNVATEDDHRKHRTTTINEWNAFAKDDWKVSKNLTMNIGLRFDYFGSPFFKEGFTSTPIGKGNGLFGIGTAPSGNIFSNWMAPGGVYLSGYGTNPTTTPLSCQNGITQLASLPMSTCDPNKLTTIEFVGPHTPNPDKTILPNDLNNFGPAVGFSWQVPWFGEGKTTLRGGYQMTYAGSGRLVGGGGANSIEGVAGNSPGAISNGATVLSDYPGVVFNLANASQLVPVRPTNPALPGGQILVYSRSSAISAYAPDFKTSYTQNFTLSLQRNVNRKIQVSLNYVGTIAKRLQTSVNPNLANIYYNKELMDALELTREGGESPLLDQMMAGLDLHGTGTPPTGVNYGLIGTTSLVNGVATVNHASDHLRRSNTLAANNISIQSNLANGNLLAVAQTLNTLSTALNGTTSTLQALPTDPATGLPITNVSGRVLRNGCDRIANGFTTVGPAINLPLRCFAENYISINPQMGNTTTYLASNGRSSYNAIQGQVTLRPRQGITYQATYAFAKALDLSGAPSDPLNYNNDYSLTNGDHKHEFRSNGSFELPFGPNKLVLGNSTGFVARLVERWEANIIYNVTSGAAMSVTASTGMYANFTPDNLGQFSRTGGKVNWNGPAGNGAGGAGTGGSATGTYFGSANQYLKVPDPQCALGGIVDHTDPFLYNLVTTNGTTVNNNCTLLALADANTNTIVLQQTQVGRLGNMPQNTIRGVGSWSLDGNLGKTFRITESKSLQVRVDATNVMNHPQPANPSLSLAGANTDFGSVTSKGGNGNGNPRSFQGQVRFTF